MSKHFAKISVKKNQLIISNGRIPRNYPVGITKMIPKKDIKKITTLRLVNAVAPKYAKNLFQNLPNLKRVIAHSFNDNHTSSMLGMFKNDDKITHLSLGSKVHFNSNVQLPKKEWTCKGKTINILDGKHHRGVWTITKAKPKKATTKKSLKKHVVKHTNKKITKKPVHKSIKVSKPKIEISKISKNETASYKLVPHKSLTIFNGTINKKLPAHLQYAKVNKLYLKDITLPKNASRIFMGMSYIKEIDTKNVKSIHTTNMNSLFANDSKLEKVSLSALNTDNVSDMNSMFADDKNLVSLDLRNTNTITAISTNHMKNMFLHDNKLAHLNLSPHDLFNTSANLPNHWYPVNVYSSSINLMDEKQHYGEWQNKPLSVKTVLSYNDGVVNIGLGSVQGVEGTTVEIGKNPNKLPKGYQILDPHQKIVLNDNVKDVQIIKKISNVSNNVTNSKAKSSKSAKVNNNLTNLTKVIKPSKSESTKSIASATNSASINPNRADVLHTYPKVSNSSSVSSSSSNSVISSKSSSAKVVKSSKANHSSSSSSSSNSSNNDNDDTNQIVFMD